MAKLRSLKAATPKFDSLLLQSPEERLKNILDSKDAVAIVQKMPEEELWLLIKKTGEHDSLPLLAMATAAQTQFIQDIEVWKKDRINEDSLLEWLKLLKECGTKKILQWAHEIDIDSVVLAFKQFLWIDKRQTSDDNPLERDWPSQFPPATMDGMYYYQALNQSADDIVRPIFETIAKDNHEYSIKLCEAILSELRTNLEESAYSWRTKRLCDKGFVPIEEAHSVYNFLNDRQIASLPKRIKGDRLLFPGSGKVACPLYPLVLGGESYPILMLAFSGLKDNELKEDVMFEIAAVANRVLMADGRPINPDTLEVSLKKVLGFVNIGLERMSGADTDKAREILKECYIKNLFQTGYSTVAKLRQTARKFMTHGWPALVEKNLALLDEPVASMIHGALLKIPRYASFENSESPFREFKSIDEVREVEKKIEKADYIGRMLYEVFKITASNVLTLVPERELFTWSNVLLTIWAKGVVTGAYNFSPLNERELLSVIKKMDSRDKLSVAGVKFANWLIERQPKASADEIKICRRLVDEGLAKFLDELGELSPDEVPDWRFIQSVWMIPNAISV